MGERRLSHAQDGKMDPSLCLYGAEGPCVHAWGKNATRLSKPNTQIPPPKKELEEVPPKQVPLGQTRPTQRIRILGKVTRGWGRWPHPDQNTPSLGGQYWVKPGAKRPWEEIHWGTWVFEMWTSRLRFFQIVTFVKSAHPPRTARSFKRPRQGTNELGKRKMITGESNLSTFEPRDFYVNFPKIHKPTNIGRFFIVALNTEKNKTKSRMHRKKQIHYKFWVFWRKEGPVELKSQNTLRSMDENPQKLQMTCSKVFIDTIELSLMMRETSRAIFQGFNKILRKRKYQIKVVAQYPSPSQFDSVSACEPTSLRKMVSMYFDSTSKGVQDGMCGALKSNGGRPPL